MSLATDTERQKMYISRNALTNVKPYQQYSKVKWLEDYMKCINQFRNELFIDYIENTFLPSINIRVSKEPYLAYYIQYVFGLYRPLGAASVNSFYDTGEKYDSVSATGKPIIYDDSEEYNGRIGMKEFLILLRFTLNYGQEVVNLPYILNFVAEICDIKVTEIKVAYPDEETIKIIMPNNVATQNFLKMTINYWDWLGLPFGVNLDFSISEDE